MLEFKNRELLEKYQYNTVALSNDLMDRMHHIANSGSSDYAFR